ncbi:ABC transporter ATP-binding protein [Flaviramulus sp. BrNp1-15]|uniref:ABC transporter ATP-binding protein n=1 Tax=Flaviramulus sp. BrNp1-15 TaxID=2916754 RepID=UPI001EE86E6E|nr:ABC transporter ATP-binding protein [Flaviramulus sp. BrNp1-15]ULC60554.1 ABC transporter ATP-binding protein [Flaviramulus sp. BrNp1-15]
MKKDIILKGENISKQYRLGLVGTGTIGHDFNRWWNKIRGKEDPYLKIGEANDRSIKGDSEYVWALKNINFEVERGEVLGIIGKNGAGKSTLLKLLSKVTAPTTGEIKTKGRIASLLEVGTGFHPEMTGKENIFLNGAILGMTKKEIESKLDNIIEFSGCERYIDTPVKRYSSGMTVRLAFAVAAHLDPDILVIDEVLAVGDAEFQKKAIGKMQDISKGEGRTVLFVSHNMAAVKSLCNRAMLLEHGHVIFEGQTDEVISYYMKGDSGLQNLKVFDNLFDNNIFTLNEICVKNKDDVIEKPIVEDKEIELITNITIKGKDFNRYHVTYHLNNELGEALFAFSHNNISLKKGLNKLHCYFPKSFFQSGEYFLSFFLIEDKRKAVFHEKDIISFTIIDKNREIGTYMGKEPGYIKPVFKWENK